ncbi:unnamed protein product [Symbiodinium sp. CCMP2592]|nr:unnamed protein product [Symbiodinium sp. CCMP2592]
MHQRAQELTEQLHDVLQRFRASELWENWNTQQSLSGFVDECGHLILVVQAACDPDMKLTSETAESLKAARQALLQKKNRAVFLESLTLFPLGQYVQQTCNEMLEGHYRDVGFSSDLEGCVTACAELKTYSPETVVKGDAMEISVEQMQKVIDILQKWSMIELAASKNFKEMHASKLSIIDAKFEELAGALKVACTNRFRKLVSDDLQPHLESLSQGKMSVLEGLPALAEALNKSKLWVPCSMTVLQKCLGSKSKPLISTFTHVREFLSKMAKVCPSIVAIIQIEQTGEGVNQYGPSRLLIAELIDFMRAFSDPNMQSSLSSMDNAWWLVICACMDKLCKGAMTITANETTGFRKFIQFVASDTACGDNFADIVGEFHEDDSDNMIDFTAVFELYGAHIGQGWSPLKIDITTTEGEDGPTTIDVSSAALCAAGALLPMAKMIVHMTGWLKTQGGMQASYKADISMSQL